MRAFFFSQHFTSLVVLDGDFDINSGFDGDGSDLLDGVSRSLQVDQTLVDAHFEAIPGVGTFTAGRLASGDLKNSGGEGDGTSNTEVLILSTLDQIIAY